ncbi:hypothetical protein [Aquamicrobium ahrensii]|uniref:Uncharacterized protein n=1 Tax=Aquamicrobium ahrensii TaxID=469551 RepID=A0ABV2KNQ5_9HYPH
MAMIAGSDFNRAFFNSCFQFAVWMNLPDDFGVFVFQRRVDGDAGAEYALGPSRQRAQRRLALGGAFFDSFEYCGGSRQFRAICKVARAPDNQQNCCDVFHGVVLWKETRRLTQGS